MKYYLPDLLNNAHRKIEEGFLMMQLPDYIGL